MISSASERPGPGGTRDTDQSQWWQRGAGARTPSHPLLGDGTVILRITAASSQAGEEGENSLLAPLFL